MSDEKPTKTEWYNGPFSTPISLSEIEKQQAELSRLREPLFSRQDIESAIVRDSDVRSDLSNLCKSIERMDEQLNALAEVVKASDKATLIDVGEAGGNVEDAKAFVVELSKRGCKTFAQGTKVVAWGDAFEKAMEREAMKPIPIQPLPKDPEAEKRIWLWYGALFR